MQIKAAKTLGRFMILLSSYGLNEFTPKESVRAFMDCLQLNSFKGLERIPTRPRFEFFRLETKFLLSLEATERYRIASGEVKLKQLIHAPVTSI
jgi:hypothetical protein